MSGFDVLQWQRHKPRHKPAASTNCALAATTAGSTVGSLQALYVRMSCQHSVLGLGPELCVGAMCVGCRLVAECAPAMLTHQRQRPTSLTLKPQVTCLPLQPPRRHAAQHSKQPFHLLHTVLEARHLIKARQSPKSASAVSCPATTVQGTVFCTNPTVCTSLICQLIHAMCTKTAAGTNCHTVSMQHAGLRLCSFMVQPQAHIPTSPTSPTPDPIHVRLTNTSHAVVHMHMP